MADYTVNYNIKANTFNTIQQLTELARVAGKMNGAAKQIEKVTTAINNLNRACGGYGGKGIAIKIDISQAQKQIASLEAQVQKLRNSLAAGGKAGPVAGGRGGSGNRGGRSGSSSSRGGGSTGIQPVANYGGRTSYMRQPARPASSRVIPRNIAYRNLGPAFIDSGSGALDMVKGMGIMYGLSGMGAMFGQAVSDYVDYNNIITTTRSILGPHDKRPNFNGRFAGMEKQIRQIGMRTKYTAPEVADASRYLAMAGLDIEAINKAMNPITNIALISDSDLAETADVVTNIMTSYKMKPEQLTEIADHLTMGFTMSNTTLMEMAEAYKYFGSIASNVGVDFKETVAMLGILGDAGLKGSHAGTTMRQIMNNMMKPTKKQIELWSELGIERTDSEGNLKSMIQLFSELAEKGAVKRAFELFRVTAAQGAVSLISDQMGPHKLQRIMAALNEDSGIASSLAEAKINNLEGLWKQIQSSFTEAAMQALADFEPQVTNVMKQLINWLQSNEGRSFVRELTGSIFELMKGVGKLTVYFVDMYRKFAPLINFWLKLQIILKAIIIPMRVIKGLWNFFLGGAAIAQKMGTWTRSFADFRLAFKDTGSLRAGASAFMNTMRGVAYTAQQTAGIVTSSGMAIMGANGKVMGSLGIQGTPLSGKNGDAWVARRNFFENKFFSGNGSMARLTRLRTEMARNSDIMYNLANTTNSKLPESERQRLLAFYSGRNQAIWNQIEKMYQGVDPSKNKNLTSARNLQRLQGRVNQYRGLYESYKQRYGENSRGAKTWYGKWKDANRRLQSATMGARNGLGIAQANYAAMQEANQMAGGGYVYNPQERRTGGFWSRQWGRAKTAGRAIRNSWNNPNHRAGWAGGAGIAGGAIGAIAGSTLGSGDYSGMVWGTLGSLLPLFASTGPGGWIAGAIAGVGALTYEFINMSKATDKARESLLHVGDAVNMKNGYLSGTDISDMERTYSLMYAKNMSINDVIASRVELLGKQQDIEDYLSGKQEKTEWEEELRGGFIEGYEQIRNATNGWEKFWGGYERALAAGRVALGNLQHGDLLTSSGEWIGYGGASMPLAGKNGKTIATLAAGYMQGFRKPTPEIFRANKKWEEDYAKFISEGNWTELAKLHRSITDTLEGYMSGADPTTRPDVFDSKVRKLTPDQMMNFYTLRQGTYDRYKYWLDEDRWNDIQSFKAATESGNFSQDIVMRFLYAMSRGQSLLSQFGTPNWLGNIQYNAQQRGFYGQHIIKDNGEIDFQSGLDAASRYVQEFEALQKNLNDLATKYPAIQSMVPNILQPFQDIYKTAQDQIMNPNNYNITVPQVAMHGDLTLSIGRAGTRYYLDADVDFGNAVTANYSNGNVFSRLVSGLAGPSYVVSRGQWGFPTLQRRTGVVPQFTPTPQGRSGGRPGVSANKLGASIDYKSQYYNLNQPESTTPPFYTINIDNMVGTVNGELSAKNIRDLGEEVEQRIVKVVTGISTQYGYPDPMA